MAQMSEAHNSIFTSMDEYAKQVAIGFHHWEGLDAYFYDRRKNRYFPKKQDGLREKEIDYVTPEELYNLYLQSKNK